MVEFYRRYLFGENISKSESLRQAQLAVIEQLRKQYGATYPAYWGAFVCIGEPGLIESIHRNVIGAYSASIYKKLLIDLRSNPQRLK
jgi:hypothetical protein